MAQPRLAPQDRQDVISALLDDYAFGRSDVSPYAQAFGEHAPPASPAHTLKELPPPPLMDSEKPLPPVMMRFQLRVDEAISPREQNGSPESLEHPKTIRSLSISRKRTPTSLKLAVSNGSTAALPTASSSTATLPHSPAPSKTPQGRPLPRLPPPPPEKSQLRNDMGNRSSKESTSDQPKATVIKRKAVPTPAPAPATTTAAVASDKKPLTLADLGRGRKVGPKSATGTDTETSSSVNLSTKSHSAIEPAESFTTAGSGHTIKTKETSEDIVPPQETLIRIDGPPTPDNPPAAKSAQPQQFRGLPAGPSPRLANTQPTPQSAQHFRGKSSTGFDLFKTSKGAGATKGNGDVNGRANANTITPSPTPSPTRTAAAQSKDQNGPQSPVSPVAPPAENEEPQGHRPFSFEPTAAPLQQAHVQEENPFPPAQPRPPVVQEEEPFSPARPQPPFAQDSSSAASPTQFPPRTASKPQPGATQFPPRTTSKPQPGASQFPTAPRAAPAPPVTRPQFSPTSPASPASPTSPLAQSPVSPDAPITPPPASPLPVAGLSSLPKIPPVKQIHINCYHGHRRFHRSSNRFAPTACMLCHEKSNDDFWSCTWCSLRVCTSCRGDLEAVPGKNLGRLMERKKFDSGVDGMAGPEMPGVVVWESREGSA